MAPWLLVSPASRGLGLTLAQRLFNNTTLPIIATSRQDPTQTREAILSNAPANSDASRLHVLPLDVTNESTIESAAKTCADLFPNTKSSPSHLHAAFVLPGILHPEKAPSQIDAAAALDTLRVNTLGPMLMLKHFAAFLPRNATPVDVAAADTGGVLPGSHAVYLMASARVGSISDNKGVGGWFSYRASKAGVTQLARTFDNYLRPNAGDKALSMAYHPGTVKTGLSKAFWSSVEEGKLFSTEYAVDKLLEVVKGSEGRVKDVRGRFWDWKGDEVLP